MKKFLIVLTVLLLIGAGWFTYQKWVKHADLTAWSFIPSDAAVVISTDILKDVESLKGNPIWENLRQTKGLNSIDNGISYLDSINGAGGFSAIFKEMPALISVHKVSNTEIDYLFVLDVQNLSQNTFISASIGRLKESGYRFKTRNYNGFSISELNFQGGTFTYIFYKNFFLASFTPYLVEDAIRTINESAIASFEVEHGIDEANDIHINYDQFGGLLSVFLTNKIDLPLSSGSYELTIDSTYVNISGVSKAADQWMNINSAAPAAFEMAEVVPANTSSLIHITSTDFNEWKTAHTEFTETTPEVASLRDSLKENLDFNVEQVFDLLDTEIGLARLESSRPDEEPKLFILKVNNSGEALNFFSSLSERIAHSRGDTVYTESYSENEIRFLPIQDFPKSIVGEMASGFDRCFYYGYRNYVVFSNSIQELRTMLESLQNEDTWGKSLAMNEFLSKINGEANVNLIVNIPRYWPELEKALNTSNRANFRNDRKYFEKIDLAAFQFTRIDDNYFTNLTFSQPRRIITTVAKTSADNAVTFAGPVISKPYLVRSHAHNFFDIFVQDSAFNLYFFDQSFSSLWSQQLEEPILGEVYPIDYYRNAKIQYAFATSSKVHIIDRLGNYIPGYPKQLPQPKSIQHFNLIDYEKNRNYRLAITDTEGNVYLSDKDLKILEGWDPIPYRRPAINPLRHARLGRRDVMISIQEDGVINLTNRRGIKESGFPFDLNESIVKNYFLSTSNSLGRSSISVMTQQGELIEVNLEGIVINRDQMIKGSTETTFEFIPDRAKKSFVIIRKEGNSLEVLDATGNLLFSKDYLSGSDIIIQYYQLGAGKDLVTFTDTETQSLYIYDKSGELVTGNPIKSGNEISLLYSSSKKELQVYTTSGSNLEYYSFDY